MFETAELGQSVPTHEFKRRVRTLRGELLAIQTELRERGRTQAIIVFAGVDGAGKGSTVKLLYEWMDSHYLSTHAFSELTDVDGMRPEFWRYWRNLPPRGRIGFFLSAWYSAPLLDRVYDRITDLELDARLDRIAAFERALVEDGAAVLKFWMHLSRGEQRKRLRSLERDRLTRGQVTKKDWRHWKLYDRFIETAERLIRTTSTGEAPWTIVEGTDPHYRSLTVGTAIRDGLHARMAEVEEMQNLRKRQQAELAKVAAETAGAAVRAGKRAAVAVREPGHVSVVSELDMSKSVAKKPYEKELTELQQRLLLLSREARACGVSSILLFEGWDAAGKGGAIRRVTGGLDPHNYQIHGFSAPTDEERAQHYLWRFWRHLPRAGHVTLYDRSWYGRVLVERVEGFASEEEWRRAYAEINEFEAHLVEFGIVLVKYWLHITPEEQMRRFKERERVSHKRWKITEEDWRNRAKWPAYEVAVHDMIHFTSTRDTFWHLIPADDKNYGRLKVLRVYHDQLAARLKKRKRG